MSKHTPGPWIVNHVPTSAGSAYSIGGAGVQKGCAWIYADGIRKGVDDEIPRAQELAANARLIAAAPDLLRALRDCEMVMSRDLQGLTLIQPELREAQAAIAKATGEQA